MKILINNSINFSIIEYIKSGITKKEIVKICQILKVKPIDIVRTSDSSYKDLNINSSQEKDDQHIIKVIIKNPKILQRPIIIKGEKGVIGRPPEKIHELL